jgi:hypothetical protein
MAVPGAPIRLRRMLYELARRSDNGIIVRLLWDPRGDSVVIIYRDERNEDRFVSEVPKSQALTAFHHPNSYRPAELAAA